MKCEKNSRSYPGGALDFAWVRIDLVNYEIAFAMQRETRSGPRRQDVRLCKPEGKHSGRTRQNGAELKKTQISVLIWRRRGRAGATGSAGSPRPTTRGCGILQSPAVTQPLSAVISPYVPSRPRVGDVLDVDAARPVLPVRCGEWLAVGSEGSRRRRGDAGGVWFRVGRRCLPCTRHST